MTKKEQRRKKREGERKREKREEERETVKICSNATKIEKFAIASVCVPEWEEVWNMSLKKYSSLPINEQATAFLDRYLFDFQDTYEEVLDLAESFR